MLSTRYCLHYRVQLIYCPTVVYTGQKEASIEFIRKYQRHSENITVSETVRKLKNVAIIDQCAVRKTSVVEL